MPELLSFKIFSCEIGAGGLGSKRVLEYQGKLHKDGGSGGSAGDLVLVRKKNFYLHQIKGFHLKTGDGKNGQRNKIKGEIGESTYLTIPEDSFFSIHFNEEGLSASDSTQTKENFNRILKKSFLSYQIRSNGEFVLKGTLGGAGNTASIIKSSHPNAKKFVWVVVQSFIKADRYLLISYKLNEAYKAYINSKQNWRFSSYGIWVNGIFKQYIEKNLNFAYEKFLNKDFEIETVLIIFLPKQLNEQEKFILSQYQKIIKEKQTKFSFFMSQIRDIKESFSFTKLLNFTKKNKQSE